MERLSQEVTAIRSNGAVPKPSLQVSCPEVDNNEIGTPSKKRKYGEGTGLPSYATAAAASVKGVQPLGGQHQGVSESSQQNSLILALQELQQQQNRPKLPARSPRNICFGSAKTSGDQDVENMLAANVDLVASGVGKDCSNEDLSEFLKSKGIVTVAVETLTRSEVLDQVRTKTFKITVKASQYEAALKPEVWPYRVAVRHFRAPKRPLTSWSGQSERAGGIVDKGGQIAQQKSDRGEGLGLRYLPVGHPQQKQGQTRLPTASHNLPNPVQLSNFFGLLGKLGSQEVPAH